jgi:ariadne-1
MYNEAKVKFNPDFVAKINHTMSDTEVASAIHMILSALDTVVDARNVLGWSYAYAFFIEKTSSRELFQHGQKIVEDLTEQLTKRAEQQSLVREDLHSLRQSTLAVQNQIKEFERGITID